MPNRYKIKKKINTKLIIKNKYIINSKKINKYINNKNLDISQQFNWY